MNYSNLAMIFKTGGHRRAATEDAPSEMGELAVLEIWVRRGR
jgi:hypothetical protein